MRCVDFSGDGRQEWGLGHHRSIVIGEHKIIVQHSSHRVRVMIDLHLIPEIFQRNDFRFVALGYGNVLRKGQGDESQQKNERS